MIAWVLIIDQGTFAPARFGTIGSFLTAILPLIMFAASFIMLGIFLWASFILIMSKGDPARFQTAKDSMKFAVLGLVLIATAYYFTKLAGFIAGISFGL